MGIIINTMRYAIYLPHYKKFPWITDGYGNIMIYTSYEQVFYRVLKYKNRHQLFKDAEYKIVLL